MGIDLEQPLGELHMKDARPSVNVKMVDGRVEEARRDQAIVNQTNVPVNEKDNTRRNVNGIVSGSNTKPVARNEMSLNSLKDIEPRDGMEFESKEEAFLFYREYAKSVGFAVIIRASRRSRVSGNFIDARFACTKHGSKRESTSAEISESVSSSRVSSICDSFKRKRGRASRSWEKTDCKASMHVKRKNDRWVVHSFLKDHNHEIFPDEAYYFRGHRNLDLGSGDADGLPAVRSRTKKVYVNMARQSGGHKKIDNPKGGNPKGGGTTQSLSRKHLSLEEGAAQTMLDHFLYMQDENPNFFYAIDLNEEQRLRNVFWVDPKGRLDYGHFGDVVFLDTTYIKNEYKLPFAPLIGVNHHFQFTLLGCALLADEDKSTYTWLMRTWLKAMGGLSPRVILSDQEKALKEAIAEVLPESRHCLCLWHILGKIPEKLGHVIRQHDQFMGKFNKCIFQSWTPDKVEKRWWKMVDRFNLRDEVWFQSLYEDREQWVPTYMRGIFLAGMSTAQRSESIISFFDKYLQKKTTLRDFLEQYKSILRDKYEEEVKADFETWNKQPALRSPSPIGKQMAAVYTHAIFKKFQVEVLGVVACHPRKESEEGALRTFRVQDFEENQDFIVEWDEMTSDISCLCRLFEFNGFLCRHVMIVLQMSGAHSIPSQYILKRWMKDAKNRKTIKKGSAAVESRVQRYNDLCRRAFKLSDEGSVSQESYTIAFNALEEALKTCETINSSGIVTISPETHDLHDSEGVNPGNSNNKTKGKNGASKKGQVHSEPEVVTVGIQESWQQVEQPTSRAPTLDGCFGSQESVLGMEQMNAVASRHDGYYSNQHLQGQGSLNSIASIHDVHYTSQQRLHGVGQLHFRPQSVPNCFPLQHSLQDMSTVGSTQLHGSASKHLHLKDLSRQ